MYKRFAAVAFPFALVALIGMGVWGFQENQEKNSLLIKAENQYQRAFHDLNFHMDQLQDEIGKTLAVNSRRQLTPSLANVWRLSYSAQSDVGQLPLTLMPFNKTESFLSDIGNFAHRVAVRDLQKEPLSKKEYKTLQTLYKRSNSLQEELQKVQSTVINRNLRWMDVELALAADDKKTDNTIVDGLRSIDKKAESYAEVDWGPGVNDAAQRKRETVQRIKGHNISVEEAKQRVANFLGMKRAAGVQVTKSKEKNFPVYSASVRKPGDDDRLHLDVTKKGGHVIWMVNNRDVKKRKLSLREGEASAEKYLRQHGFHSMQSITYDDYGDEAAYTFVYNEGGVTMYPDLVTVKVALDNGEVMAFESSQYVANHKERHLAPPKLPQKEALTRVNPNLKVQEVSRALINREDGTEVLCYEVLGYLGKTQYRIFVNADTGDEEKVEKIKNVDLPHTTAS